MLSVCALFLAVVSFGSVHREFFDETTYVGDTLSLPNRVIKIGRLNSGETFKGLKILEPTILYRVEKHTAGVSYMFYDASDVEKTGEGCSVEEAWHAYLLNKESIAKEAIRVITRDWAETLFPDKP